MTTGTDEPKPSKHLILLGRILLPIIALLVLWGMKTVGVMLSSLKMETIENNPEATIQTIFVWTAFVIVIILTYKIGVRFKIWSSIGIHERAKGTSTAYSASTYSTQSGGRKRFSLAAAVWTVVGLALAALIVVKILQEIDYGLSNAPERMAARGYVPRESVAAALAANAATPLLTSEPRVIAAPSSLPGVTNWSEPIMRRRGSSTHLHYTVQPGQQELVKVWKDGVETHFTNELAAFVIKFRSITDGAIEVPLREFTEEEWQQLLRERR